MKRLPVAAMRASRAIAEALRCETCGKLTTVSNTNLLRGKRGLQLERVDPATHCACPPSGQNLYGGPAHLQPGPRDSDFQYGGDAIRSKFRIPAPKGGTNA